MMEELVEGSDTMNNMTSCLASFMEENNFYFYQVQFMILLLPSNKWFVSFLLKFTLQESVEYNMKNT